MGSDTQTEHKSSSISIQRFSATACEGSITTAKLSSKKLGSFEGHHLTAKVGKGREVILMPCQGRTDLLQEAIQGILVLLSEAVFLQPQDQLRFLVWLQGQQMHQPVSEGPLRHSAAAFLDGAGEVDGCWSFSRGHCIRSSWGRLAHLDLLA